jgi:4-hydroxy 2-oxovalerate aldolase
MSTILVDCTLRDGGYYNNWDFDVPLINRYLVAMDAAGIDYAELGFRSFDTQGFRGACAYTTDDFVRTLQIPPGLKVGVMVNASELVKHPEGPMLAARRLFSPRSESPVTLVRLACHLHEFEATLPVCTWLKEIGYTVGINLMQIADRTDDEVRRVSEAASAYPLDALYFADSMGSMGPAQCRRIVDLLRTHWSGALGIHTHDNMGRALANTVAAVEAGVSWIDSTVTGMGRGPGNAQTEYVLIEIERSGRQPNISPLLSLIKETFGPMQFECGWGKNPYYYLSGKYGIHPTFIQEMLADSRYGAPEILGAIEHLRSIGAKKFDPRTLEEGLQLYDRVAPGDWNPAALIGGRSVLLLAAGETLIKHRAAVEAFIRHKRPFVIALNAITPIDAGLIDARAASHPARLWADCSHYKTMPQPLIVPVNGLPPSVVEALNGVQLLNFGLQVKPQMFEAGPTSAITPSSLAVAYALAVAQSAGSDQAFLAGFDGYGADDPRTAEVEGIFQIFQSDPRAPSLISITPTRYRIPSSSVYGLC